MRGVPSFQFLALAHRLPPLSTLIFLLSIGGAPAMLLQCLGWAALQLRPNDGEEILLTSQ